MIFPQNDSSIKRLGKIACAGAVAICFVAVFLAVTFFADVLGFLPQLFGAIQCLIAALFLGAVIAFLYQVIRQTAKNWPKHRAAGIQHREALRRQRRKIAKVRQKKSLEAQLAKPDFETRLQNFTRLPCGQESFVPKAKFWQAETDYEPSRPRSISFIRRLLIRIAKHVNKSRIK